MDRANSPTRESSIRYKRYSDQINPILGSFLKGIFGCGVNYIVDHEFHLSILDSRCWNDNTGVPPDISQSVIKIILYACSEGIIFPCEIEKWFRENAVFMALSVDTAPHFTENVFRNLSRFEYLTPKTTEEGDYWSHDGI